MIRILLEYLVPLFLPIAVYLVWTWIVGKSTRQPEDPPRWFEGPYFWLIIVGFVLMVTVMAATAILQGRPPSATYVPPHTENGEIIPGGFK